MKRKNIDRKKYEREEIGDFMIDDVLDQLRQSDPGMSDEKSIVAFSFPDEPECAAVTFMVRGRAAHAKARLVSDVINAVMGHSVRNER